MLFNSTLKYPVSENNHLRCSWSSKSKIRLQKKHLYQLWIFLLEEIMNILFLNHRFISVCNNCYSRYLLVTLSVSCPSSFSLHALDFPNPPLRLQSRFVPNSLMKLFPSTAAPAEQILPCVSASVIPRCPF